MSELLNFDWNSYVKYEKNLSKVEEVVIKEHFNIIRKGNSNMDELSQSVLDNCFEMFKYGWITNSMFIIKRD